MERKDDRKLSWLTVWPKPGSAVPNVGSRNQAFHEKSTPTASLEDFTPEKRIRCIGGGRFLADRIPAKSRRLGTVLGRNCAWNTKKYLDFIAWNGRIAPFGDLGTAMESL